MARNSSPSIGTKSSGRLRRLFEGGGENAVGQKVDVFGEQAEYELVDEMRDAAFVVLPAQQHGDVGEIGRCLVP